MAIKPYQLLITIISVILFSWGYWWFHNNFERVIEYIEVGYQGEARYNPFLAAQYLLETMGIPADTARTFATLDKQLTAQDTLILALYSEVLLTEQRRLRLQQWIESGGHLIVFHAFQSDYSYFLYNDEIEEYALEDNYIQQQFGINEHQDDRLSSEDISDAPALDIRWGDERLQVYFNPAYYLMVEDNDEVIGFQTARKHGYHILHSEYGQGAVTVLSDSTALQNADIADYDHAQFVWRLTHLHHTPQQVWIWRAYTGDFPNLWQLLWQYAWTVIITATVLLLLWLWAISRRFGSVLPEPARQRRRLLEHIEASGDFLWRYQQSAVLLKSTRQRLWQQLETLHPNWSQWSESERVAHLAAISHLPARDIEQALHQTALNRPADFTHAIQTLTQLKDAL